MAYNPPSGAAVVLELKPPYVPQSGGAVVLDFVDGRIWSTLMVRAGALATTERTANAQAGALMYLIGAETVTANALILGALYRHTTDASAALTKADQARTSVFDALLLRAGNGRSADTSAALLKSQAHTLEAGFQPAKQTLRTAGAAPCIGRLYERTSVVNSLLLKAAKVENVGASVMLKGGLIQYARLDGVVQRSSVTKTVSANVSLPEAVIAFGGRADMLVPTVDAIYGFADGLILLRPVLNLELDREWPQQPRATEWKPRSRETAWPLATRATEWIPASRPTEWAPLTRPTTIEH